jgi:2-methylisocitrate lyase-like PEP mutase family enzyme
MLPNAWDAGSARLVEHLGASAIATSSAAVAWAHGYPDGDRLPVSALAATVAEITRVIRIPLSVDMESGYAEDPATVAEHVSAVVGAGAVGINLEDGLGDPGILCAKIEHIRRAATRLGVRVFVNARTDGFLRDPAPDARKLEDTIARAGRYRAAGADGLFVPGVIDAASIGRIVSAVPLPLNVLARPALPGPAELQALGVRRLSAGSGIAERLFGQASALATEFLRTGRFAAPPSAGATYRDINGLMAQR